LHSNSIELQKAVHSSSAELAKTKKHSSKEVVELNVGQFSQALRAALRYSVFRASRVTRHASPLQGHMARVVKVISWAPGTTDEMVKD
jgi:hypothetical protein